MRSAMSVLALSGHPELKRTSDLLLKLGVPEKFRSATHVLENQ